MIPPPLVLQLAWVLAGCADAPAGGAATAWSFPHPGGFAEGSAHGPAWVASPVGCDQCHRSDEAIRFVRTCADCHPDYPHAAGFSAQSEHGPVGAGGGQRCGPCHGTGEAEPAGVAGSACRDCHRSYPHRPTWELPALHGPAWTADPTACGGCHGPCGEGSPWSDACRDCHRDFPHDGTGACRGDGALGRSWWNPARHGAVALADGVDACGGSCHGEDFAGGLSGVACAACHAPFPHGDDYLAAHRDDVLALGEEACLGCHDERRGFPADFTCTTACHGGAP